MTTAREPDIDGTNPVNIPPEPHPLDGNTEIESLDDDPRFHQQTFDETGCPYLDDSTIDHPFG